MRTYAPGSQVVHTIPFLLDGVAFEPTSVSYGVKTGAGDVIVASQPAAFVAGDGGVTITITPAQNAMAVGNRSLRVITVFCATANGTVPLTGIYVLVNADGLLIPSESFVSYWRAVEIAHSRIDMGEFIDASQSQQIAALIQARGALCLLRYKYDNTGQERLAPRALMGNLALITADEFNSFPVDFLIALATAQVYEANHLLREANDGLSEQIERFQNLGIESHKVGESSFSFGKNASRGKAAVQARTKQILARYIDQTLRIERA